MELWDKLALNFTIGALTGADNSTITGSGFANAKDETSYSLCTMADGENNSSEKDL